MEDALLIRRIKQGDEAAFDELVRRHYDSIYAFCYRRCADRSLAADLTQEVFLKLVTAVYRYSVTGKFTNYLFTIAVNVCNDYYRRKKPDSAELSEDCSALGGAEEQMLRRDSGSVIRRAPFDIRLCRGGKHPRLPRACARYVLQNERDRAELPRKRRRLARSAYAYHRSGKPHRTCADGGHCRGKV